MILRQQFIGRRGLLFTHRYYSPGGWRVPHFVWERRWNYYASGKSMCIQLSFRESAWRAVRRFA